MKVKEMMHKGAQSVAPDTEIAAIALQMKQLDIGAMPVIENGKVIGMITDRDIAIRGLANGKNIAAMTARDLMTPHVICCEENAKANTALELMENRQIRRLPVLDSKQHLVGMLSLGDVSHAVSRRNAGAVARAVSSHHG